MYLFPPFRDCGAKRVEKRPHHLFFLPAYCRLLATDVKMKDAAKKIGKQFACGSSVSKAPSGAEEIVIQGDVLMDLPSFLEATLKVRELAVFFRVFFRVFVGVFFGGGFWRFFLPGTFFSCLCVLFSDSFGCFR